MPLISLPTLETYINAFNNSKRFYHFNHSDHVDSIKLLEVTLQQYNTGISQLAVIEKTILEIKRSQVLSALVTDINLKAEIAGFYQARADILATLKNLIDSIERGASRLQPIIGKKRVGCNEFEKILALLQKESLEARKALAEEKFGLMQISSKEGMLLDKDQFAAFHQFILQQATPEIRRSYQRLNWFIGNPLDEKLIPIKIKNKSFYVLSSAKITFEQEIGGLSQLFFGEKDKLKLIEEQYYQVASIKSAQQAINTIYQTLTPDSFEQCALPEQPCLKAVIKLETEIMRKRAALQGERVTGMMKFFFGVKNAAINHELNYLNRHFALLQATKITLMENALAHLETHYHFKDLVLPPKEKLDAIEMLLSECKKGVSLIPLNHPLQQKIFTQLNVFNKKFKSCCNISVNLIEKLMQENNNLSAQRMTSSAGLSYLSYRKEIQDLFDRIRNYVSPSQQEAIDVLASVLLGTSLAPLDSIKQKLLPLFKGFKFPLKCLEVFIESFFKNYILPALHNPESYHFQLLTSYNSKWIDNWLSKKTTSLEDALIFLRTLYSGQVTLGNQVRSIRNKPFVYDRQTFIAQIKLLQSFGKQAQSKSFLESFYSIITQTIKEQGDQLCFHPDYLAGILVLKDDQLKITYIQALMKSCISKQTFDILQNKELIDYLNGSNAFEAVRDPLFAYFKQDQWQYALQSTLDQLEDETLAQEYRYIYLKNRLEHNDSLFDDKKLKSLGDDLSKAIGQENELNLYQLLARRLSSEEAIPPESLALIDSLLAANWSQNINGLRILFDKKRQLLVAQNDVAVEIKDLLNMIKLHHFEEALNKIHEHILLSTTQNNRSTLHFDIVLGFLNQLAHSHQEKEDLGLPEQKAKWAFYRALKQAIHASQWEERETSQH